MEDSMSFYTLKDARRLLGITKKQLKWLLVASGFITKTNAAHNSMGMVFELRLNKGEFIETTLYITEDGLRHLQIVIERIEATLQYIDEEVSHG